MLKDDPKKWRRRREDYKTRIYVAKDGFRWVAQDRRNGLVISASTQGYSLKGDCLSNYRVATGWAEFDEEDLKSN